MLSERYPLDPDYLRCMETCHGGVPAVEPVEVGSKKYRVERFLTLLDEKSPLPSAFRPHFDDASMDERVAIGVPFLKDYEHSTSRALFGDLLPFAATRDKMCLDRAYVNLFCFDYRDRREKPAVILWLADNANNARIDWDDLPFNKKFDSDDRFMSVPWKKFVLPIANSFAEFVALLQPSTPNNA